MLHEKLISGAQVTVAGCVRFQETTLHALTCRLYGRVSRQRDAHGRQISSRKAFTEGGLLNSPVCRINMNHLGFGTMNLYRTSRANDMLKDRIAETERIGAKKSNNK